MIVMLVPCPDKIQTNHLRSLRERQSSLLGADRRYVL